LRPAATSGMDAGVDGSALIDGAHTIGRWLTDRAATVPAHTAIDDRGCGSATPTSRHAPGARRRTAASGLRSR
jgi:hypothetical protein